MPDDVSTRNHRTVAMPSAASSRLEVGRPTPLGATRTDRGLNLAVYTSAEGICLAVDSEDGEVELELDPARHRTGSVWHCELLGAGSGTRFWWRTAASPEPLLDPWAGLLDGGRSWGRDGDGPRRWRSLFADQSFDWQGVAPPCIHPADRVVYELHVRGFTRHSSSGVPHPGTYLGLLEKIPYLRALGITTVELLPITEFDETDNPRTDPETGRPLLNVWGYSPLSFFAPKVAYASQGDPSAAAAELKTMVRELHRAGIEVVLDLVFNHTGEGEGRPGDRTICWRGLSNAVYYHLDPATGRYRDFTGCGNSINANHPVTRQLLRGALRHWVEEYRIDGFRFDLAAELTRDLDGEPTARPPLLEEIATDPVLGDRWMVAEPWDAGGLYQVGSFPAGDRFAEWNGRFRDDVRRFLAGEPGRAAALAARLAGSADLYSASGRRPFHSVNYVTAHDGFTLADLVTYERKRNLANGEQNRDGMDVGHNWNCGVEGPTTDQRVLARRRRQAKNALVIVLLAQGTPMLLAGDELGRTQRGNNNAWSHDSELSWVDWGPAAKDQGLLRFVRQLVAFRRAHAVLRRRSFLTGEIGPGGRRDVEWHGWRLGEPDWGPHSRCLAMHLTGEHGDPPDDDIYLALNASPRRRRFELPALPAGRRWGLVVDTARESPDDIAKPGAETPVRRQQLAVSGHGAVILRSLGAAARDRVQ